MARIMFILMVNLIQLCPTQGPALWLSQNRDQISALVVDSAKEGLSPSEIGLRLRDVHGIPLVKPVMGKSLTSILAENGIKSDMPEDLDKRHERP